MGDVGERTVEQTAAELDLLRRRVLNVVGHELRTPITTLRGLADQLDGRLDQEATVEVHDAIRRTARRIEGLVDAMLVAAGVSTALPVGAPVPTPVAGAVAEAADEATGSVPTIDGDLDAVVAARRGALRRVLAPILVNAATYGGGAAAVVVAHDGPDVVVVTVTDQGPGIPAAELTLVTEPFFRGERAVMTTAGLGLGLAVATAIAEQHGASVSMRNGDAGGAVAEVRWPTL